MMRIPLNSNTTPLRYCSDMPNSVKLRGLLPQTASWARILDDGRLELEHYDFSGDAEKWFGHDVAWIYRVQPADKPRVYELLVTRSGKKITDDQTMLDAFVWLFRDVKEIRDLLKENGVLYEEVFDSWA